MFLTYRQLNVSKAALGLLLEVGFGEQFAREMLSHDVVGWVTFFDTLEPKIFATCQFTAEWTDRGHPETGTNVESNLGPGAQ